MSKFNPNIEEAIVEGKAKGFEVIQSTPNTLLLDLDTPAQSQQFADILPLVQEFIRVGEIKTWKSKNGNEHVLITLKETLHPLTRVALETALGSDPKRAVFQIGRIKAGVREPGLLFKPATPENTPIMVGPDKDEDAPF